MIHRVIYAPEAEMQLVKLYTDIAVASSPAIAARYTDKLVDFCEGLATFPNRGSKRDDIRPGLRAIGYRRRVTIAFDVVEDLVTIHGLFYGGQDFGAVLNLKIGLNDDDEAE
jgi:plasmid stabilization system protein ParE